MALSGESWYNLVSIHPLKRTVRVFIAASRFRDGRTHWENKPVPHFFPPPLTVVKACTQLCTRHTNIYPRRLEAHPRSSDPAISVPFHHIKYVHFHILPSLSTCIWPTLCWNWGLVVMDGPSYKYRDREHVKRRFCDERIQLIIIFAQHVSWNSLWIHEIFTPSFLVKNKRNFFFLLQVIMGDRTAAERACKDPNPIIDGRKANVNLAILGAKPRGNITPGKLSYLPLSIEWMITRNKAV